MENSVSASSQSAKLAQRRSSARRQPAQVDGAGGGRSSVKSNVAALTKSNLVYADLRSRILSGELEPGTRLVIRKIAERHSVSDIPVREALRLLEKDNLIHYHPYGSSFVRQASDEEVY